jgi:hypothetical protein|tara:strand:- start:373 stop:549 length:177 start_codon:yes stop_codon:yes gene_type:complete
MMLNKDFNYLYRTTVGQIVFDQMCQAVLFSKDQMLDEMSSNQELVREFISKCILKGAR